MNKFIKFLQENRTFFIVAGVITVLALARVNNANAQSTNLDLACTPTDGGPVVYIVVRGQHAYFPGVTTTKSVVAAERIVFHFDKPFPGAAVVDRVSARLRVWVDAHTDANGVLNGASSMSAVCARKPNKAAF